jgi:hypothetical protein
MVTNSFETKNVKQSMRRLNMSSRDFLFWVERGEGEGSQGKHDCASTLGSVGAKGMLLLGTDQCSRKIGDEPISFSSSKTLIFKKTN